MSYLRKALGIVPVASLGLFNHKLLPRECKIMGLEDRLKKKTTYEMVPKLRSKQCYISLSKSTLKNPSLSGIDLLESQGNTSKER